MDPVRAAIFSALTADATLMTLATQAYHSVAPQSAAFPLIVFNQASGTPILQFQGAHIQNDLWQIKGIARGSSATPAEDIAARVDVVLDNASLAITGRVHLYLRRESDVPTYSEQESGETFWHCGSLYRIFTVPA